MENVNNTNTNTNGAVNESALTVEQTAALTFGFNRAQSMIETEKSLFVKATKTNFDTVLVSDAVKAICAAIRRTRIKAGKDKAGKLTDGKNILVELATGKLVPDASELTKFVNKLPLTFAERKNLSQTDVSTIFRDACIMVAASLKISIASKANDDAAKLDAKEAAAKSKLEAAKAAKILAAKLKAEAEAEAKIEVENE